MKLCTAAILAALACASTSVGPAPGRYGADTPHHPGFVQLRVGKDGAVTFLHVVTLHLPPAELERHDARLIKKDGKVCMEPPPQDVLPCLGQDKQGNWQLTLKEGARVVTLTREPDAAR